MMFRFDLMETMPLVQGTKVCRDCKEPKPVSGFYFNKTLDTHQPYCKPCAVVRAMAWANEHPAERAIISRKHSRVCRDKYPDQIRCRSILNSARRKGEITATPCMVCGLVKVDAHHYLGYALEHALHVQWLCRKHHQIADGNSYMRYPSYSAMLADIRIGIAFQATAQSNPLLSLMELSAWAHATALEMTKHYRPEGWKETH